MFFKCARDRSQWSRRPGMIHRLLRAVDKVPCAKHCRWRWPAVSCAAAARSRRAQLALCRRHALDRTGKQSWHAAAEPYTPHGNGLDETSTAAMEAVLRHGKNKSSRSTVRVVCYRQIHTVALTLALVTVVASEGKEQRKHVLQWSYCDVSGRAKAGRTSNLRDRASFPGKRPRCPFLLLAYAPFRPFATALHIALAS